MAIDENKFNQLLIDVATMKGDIDHIKDQALKKLELSEAIYPLKEDMTRQGKNIENLTLKVSEVADSYVKLNEIVGGVLTRYNESLLDQARAWSLSNVFRISSIVLGAVAGFSTLGTLIYAAIRFIAKQP